MRLCWVLCHHPSFLVCLFCCLMSVPRYRKQSTNCWKILSLGVMSKDLYVFQAIRAAWVTRLPPPQRLSQLRMRIVLEATIDTSRRPIIVAYPTTNHWPAIQTNRWSTIKIPRAATMPLLLLQSWEWRTLCVRVSPLQFHQEKYPSLFENLVLDSLRVLFELGPSSKYEPLYHGGYCTKLL